eukprot:TRINITY_DN24590_c0_g1_i1.p2 TRINITY_DN24590_c0_g1~~TRINITY_DN24590_c0_g1_i1.p2  ORF type:complete len:150 (+),score=34.81 TRINITY_DN24590_c0_g1_i1:301-750(+)
MVDAFEEWARRKEHEHEEERKAMETRMVEMERRATSMIWVVQSMEKNMANMSEQITMMATRLETLDNLATAMASLTSSVRAIQASMQAKRPAKKSGATTKKAQSGSLAPTAGTGVVTPMSLPSSLPLHPNTPPTEDLQHAEQMEVDEFN